MGQAEAGVGQPDGADGPGDEDEARVATLAKMASEVSLRGAPVAGNACQGCEYYLQEEAAFSYCWHPSLRILVSKDWWCQWYEERA